MESSLQSPHRAMFQTRTTSLFLSLILAMPSSCILFTLHTAFPSILLLQSHFQSPNAITSPSLLKPFPVRLGQGFPIMLVISMTGVVFNIADSQAPWLS